MMRVAVTLLALALATLWLRPAPAIVADAAPLVQPIDTRERFALDVLSGLGNTSPTPEVIAFMVVWSYAEDGSDGAISRHNAYNTTMCGYNQISAINGDGACGVAGYATHADGVAATVATLLQDNFSPITAALRANDPEAAKRALWASPWASSHYGYGAAWPKEE